MERRQLLQALAVAPFAPALKLEPQPQVKLCVVNARLEEGEGVVLRKVRFDFDDVPWTLSEQAVNRIRRESRKRTTSPVTHLELDLEIENYGSTHFLLTSKGTCCFDMLQGAVEDFRRLPSTETYKITGVRLQYTYFA